MARRAVIQDDSNDSEDGTANDALRPPCKGEGTTLNASPSSAASFESDKENRLTKAQKGKQRAMGPPETPASNQASARRSLKRKLAERDATTTPAPAPHQEQIDETGDTRFYDPNQSMEQRRAVRKDYRDLSKELTDSRSEYLAPGSQGLVKTLNRSNELFASIKQTSDATLDSRLLVSTADLSMKRTTQLNLGDSSTGIDLDDFVSKCITFMRRGPSEGDASTQRQTQQRRRRMANDSDDEGNTGYDEGDAFNWEYLGRHACIPFNVRPPVPGFLLGPLSVQKRPRKATQRAATQRRDIKDAVRPTEIQAKDLEDDESSSLKVICMNVRKLLSKHQERAESRVQDEVTDEMSDVEIRESMSRHGIADDGGVPLFPFIVNPQSFGQTVENLFHISFLIKEGGVSIGSDSDGMPTLMPTTPRSNEEQQQLNISKHQAILHLDFETWEDIIETFNIHASIIPHRQPDPSSLAQGFYD